jgi:hypothetical protein
VDRAFRRAVRVRQFLNAHVAFGCLAARARLRARAALGASLLCHLELKATDLNGSGPLLTII